jgi:hypothetical protein
MVVVFRLDPSHGTRASLELTRALTALQKRQIDPWSRDVARVAYQFTRASHVGDEAEHYRIAQKGLSDLLTEVDGMSHANALLRTCLKEIETRLGGVAGLRPEPDDDGGAPLNVPQMEALLLAAELKWDASAAAAVLFLTGVLPADRFEVIRNRLGTYWTRAGLPIAT